MDKFNYVGDVLRKTKKNLHTSLNRPYEPRQFIERGRDIFDTKIPFEFHFNILSPPNAVQLNLVFEPIPTYLSSCCAGCYCSICEIFSGVSGDGILTTSYSYQPNSLKVYASGPSYEGEQELIFPHYINGGYSYGDWVEINPTTIQLDVALTDSIFKVCYVYKIDGCV